MAKVLLVEDDEILQGMYRKLLKSQGFEVILSKQGDTGLALAHTDSPDLILLDIMLGGGLNGFDVLERLKQNPVTKNIPVIVLTNLDSEEKVAKEIGADEYLVKVKTKPDQVVDKVKELLVKK